MDDRHAVDHLEDDDGFVDEGGEAPDLLLAVGGGGGGADDEDVDEDHEDEAPAEPQDVEAENGDLEDDDEVESVEVRGFRRAVTLLEDAHDRSAIDELVVRSVTPVADRANDVLEFSRFVDLLQEGGRDVRRIDVDVDWSGFPDDHANVMERLFGTVLPAHRTITAIDINIHFLPVKYLQMFTEAIPTATAPSSPLRLSFDDAVGEGTDPEKLDAIVAMVKRNAQVKDLTIYFDLENDQVRLVCQALPSNTKLHTLIIHVRDAVVADALDGVATSSLKSLWVHAGTVTDDAVASLARGLRTNDTLTELSLFPSIGPDGAQALLELVQNYNYTIRVRHGVAQDQQLQPILLRNQRIRRGIRFLQSHGREETILRIRDASTRESVSRHFSLIDSLVLRDLLVLVRPIPTAGYHIVKRVVKELIADALAAQAAAQAQAQTIDGTGGLPATTNDDDDDDDESA